MKPTRTVVVTAVGVAVALATVGGVSVAASAGSTSTPYRVSAVGSSGSSRAGGVSGTPSHHVVVSTATASVQGRSQRILVDDHGDPLYFYKPDTATQSRVAGQLAVLWPAVVGSTVTAHGVPGRLRTVSTSHGRQVTYNGRLLYTFVQDRPGKVTGQGVQSFFVATAGVSSTASSGTAANKPTTKPATRYGY
jgi:predicted lipoprotein with Yx(FWY)xxD motif